MRKNGKRKGVSRRDFLKGLGAGAVGAAVISTRLLEPFQAAGASAAQLADVRAGVRVDATAVQALQGVLRDQVLKDIISASGVTDPEVLVNCRLNITGRKDAAPVWYGWVESDRLQKESGRGGRPPARLIGSDRLSRVYEESYQNPKTVRGRNYPADAAKEKVPDQRGKPAFSIDVRLGLNWRRYICVKAGGLKAGTLTVGFAGAPAKAKGVEDRLKFWAQDPKSALVKLLEGTFNLGGDRYPV